MIAGLFHEGSGLGNQLFRYVATRVLALDKGYEWGMGNPELFKGSSFMKLDTGKSVAELYDNYNRFEEKKVIENGVDIRSYDPEINFVEDNTIIDGEFQDPRYFEHRLPEIRKWLKLKDEVNPTYKDMFTCIIGFRGGEYVGVRDLFLTLDYWEDAIEKMREINPDMKFEVHTDDPITAKKFFPDFPIINDMEKNWLAVRYASYLIISNSSFYILPALLNQVVQKTIAPRYWARRNIGVWALPSNYYKQFTYI